MNYFSGYCFQEHSYELLTHAHIHLDNIGLSIMQTKGIRKQDPEVNIESRRDENGEWRRLDMRNFIICIFRLI